MSASITIIDPDSALLRVERVFVDGAGELRANVSGVECCVGTKASLVDAGLVVFRPVNAQLARRRPVFSRLNVSGSPERYWCVATDPRLVNGAVRFNVLKKQSSTVAAQQLWP